MVELGSGTGIIARSLSRSLTSGKDIIVSTDLPEVRWILYNLAASQPEIGLSSTRRESTRGIERGRLCTSISLGKFPACFRYCI